MVVPVTFEILVNKARNSFLSGKTRSLTFRLEQIQRLSQMVSENYDELANATVRDFGKCKFEVRMTELDILQNYLSHIKQQLKEWVKPEKLPLNLLVPLDAASIARQPYGVVLILGTWNFPIVLALHPFIGAIAAGNAAILKPSEVAHYTATTLAKLIPQYLDSDCYRVILGDAEDTQRLLKLKFDYIFCTGSTQVGKYVMKAAAENLTPVTLELGGKSPCYVDESADVDLVARRIIFGKMANLGQACVSPDYVICSRKIEADLVSALGFAMKTLYGSERELQRSPQLGRIINEKHCLRLKRLLENTKGRIVYGGEVDLEDLWVQPTIVVDVDADDVLMQEEIFGPILPIFRTAHVELAIDFITSKPNPLCLYIFSTKSSVTDRLEEAIQSGSICINDTLVHCMRHGIPFGGIGESGMGFNGQGKLGFDAFSHKRGILKRPLMSLDERLLDFRYPPLSNYKTKLTSLVYRTFPLFNVEVIICVRLFVAFFTGAISLLCIQTYTNWL